MNVRLTEKYLFDKEKMVEKCIAHYQAKGYSEEHSRAYITCVPDERLQEVYEIICEEEINAKKQGDHLL